MRIVWAVLVGVFVAASAAARAQVGSGEVTGMVAIQVSSGATHVRP